MKRSIALFWVLTLALCLNFASAYDEAEVQKKTIAVTAILDSVYKNPQQKAKYMVVFKEIFQWCAKTCKNEDSKELSSRILETYDEKYLGTEKKPEEVKKEEVKQEEPKSEENKEEVTKVDVREDKHDLIDPTKPFEYDGIEYEILWFKTFDKVWTLTRHVDYRKSPENDTFLIMELTFKNVSWEDWEYRWSFQIVNWENQYDESITADVYADEQMWYKPNSATKMNNWVKVKWWLWFDIKREDIWKWRLILKAFGSLDKKIDLDITKIPVVAWE